MTSRRRYSTSGASTRAASSDRRGMSSECATVCICLGVMYDIVSLLLLSLLVGARQVGARAPGLLLSVV
jgi:hypothetical protein